jgi:predicted phosphodiesterase
MIIGVCADIHDHLDNLRKMLVIFAERQVEAIIFCGDFCSPIPSRVITAEFKGDIHCVFGNGDGDRFLIDGVALIHFMPMPWPGPAITMLYFQDILIRRIRSGLATV